MNFIWQHETVYRCAGFAIAWEIHRDPQRTHFETMCVKRIPNYRYWFLKSRMIHSCCGVILDPRVGRRCAHAALVLLLYGPLTAQGHATGRGGQRRVATVGNLRWRRPQDTHTHNPTNNSNNDKWRFDRKTCFGVLQGRVTTSYPRPMQYPDVVFRVDLKF